MEEYASQYEDTRDPSYRLNERRVLVGDSMVSVYLVSHQHIRQVFYTKYVFTHLNKCRLTTR